MYSNADIYLFDDPLSAVDPKVGNILFNRAVCQALAGKTRLLVTHQLQFLSSPAVSRVIVLELGSIKSIGTYTHLKESGALDWMAGSDTASEEGNEVPALKPSADSEGDMRDILVQTDNFSTRHLSGNSAQDDARITASQLHAVHSHELVHGEHVSTVELVTADMEEVGTAMDEGGATSCGVNGVVYQAVGQAEGQVPMRRRLSSDGTEEGEPVYEKDKQEDPNVGGITVAEDRSEGRVSLSTYLKYFASMGGLTVSAALLVFMAIGQVSHTLIDDLLSNYLTGLCIGLDNSLHGVAGHLGETVP